MQGYYKNPEATAEVMDQAKAGFIQTIMGTFVEGRFLKLRIEKKNFLKLVPENTLLH